MKTKTLTTLILLALLAGFVYLMTNRSSDSEVVAVSEPATARVRQEDFLVRVSGSGKLVADEIPLAFTVAGEISELNVKVGDTVQAGDLLARLESSQAELDLKQAQLNWSQLTEPVIIADAERQVIELGQALAVVEAELAYTREGPEVWYYQALLDQAREDYEETRQEYLRALRLSRTDPRTYRPKATQLGKQKERAWEALESAEADLAWVKQYQPDPQALLKAETQVQLARARLAAQQAYLKVLRSEAPLDTERILASNPQLLALEKAKLGLQKAEWTLQQKVLYAPTAGTVTQLLAAPGMYIEAGKSALVLTELDTLRVRMEIEETDLGQISIGNRLEILLDAYPDQTFQGVITRIDPASGNADSSMVIQVWGSLTGLEGLALYPGMSLEVEAITGEASEALLVPLQAVRQNEEGTYYVDILQPDGTFKSNPVQVGLKDLANAQILEGVQVGDMISIAAR